MALAANALTTLATVKDDLSVTGTESDNTLERLINAASDRIEKYCDRSFYKESGKVEDLGGYGGFYLTVSKTPLLSVTEIKYDGETLDPDGYEIDNAKAGLVRSSSGFVWTAGTIQSITPHVVPGTERKLYEVTYTGGYVTPEQAGTRDLPYDLEDACILLVAKRFRRKGKDPGIKSKKLMSYAVTYGGQGAGDSVMGIPAEIAHMLNPYKRLGQA